MTAVNCFATQNQDVPVDDAWLSPAELTVLASLAVPKRHDDWRLGRWVAKQAVARTLGRSTDFSADLARISVVAAGDGAPEAWIDGERAPVELSISHRAGRGLGAVAALADALGCDLELIEPRSDAFVREWLAPEEQRLVDQAGPDERSLLANVIWVAKESAAKAQRAGLRLAVRHAVVGPDVGAVVDGWHPCRVECRDERVTYTGWWCERDGFVAAVLAAPPPGVPTWHDLP